MFKLRLSLSLIILCLTLTVQVSGQEQKVGGSEKQADIAVSEFDYDWGISQYERIISKSDNPEERARVAIKMGHAHSSKRDHERAAEAYAIALEEDGGKDQFSKTDVISAIRAFNRIGDVAKARDLTNAFMYSPKMKGNVQFQNYLSYLNGEELALEKLDALYETEILDFNTTYSDFWTGRLANGTKLFIRSDNGVDGIGGQISNLISGARFYLFDERGATPYGKLKTNLQAGPATFSEDGKTVIVTDNKHKPGELSNDVVEKPRVNTLGLRETTIEKGVWSRGEYILEEGIGDTVSNAHPWLLESGKTLIFSSDRPGGYGGMDLYVAKKGANGEWGNITNLGPVINTAGDEIYPTANEDVIYFSSDGHPGYGAMDIYSVRVGDDGYSPVAEVQRYPYPLNTEYNDYALYTIEGVDRGFFTSDRIGGAGLDDIYSYRGDEEALAKALAAKNVEADTLVLDEGNTDFLDENSPDVQIGEVINSIFFAFDDSSIKNIDEVSAIGLEQSIEVLKNHNKDGFKYELVGFADPLGNETYNQKLSVRRAKSVRDHLVKNGVNIEALEAKGLGEDPNADEYQEELPSSYLSSYSKSYTNTYRKLGAEDRKKVREALQGARRVDIIRVE